MSYYLGVDLGTSGMKIGVIDSELKIVYNDIETYPIFTNGLESEQKPSDWWEAFKELMKRMPANFKSELVSVSFSGQMHGMVAIDKDGEVLHNAILWNDTRTFEEVEELNKDVFAVSNETGNMALEGFTGPKIIWLKKNKPEIFEKTKMILLPKDWLVYKLTGSFATDPSDASGTLYFNQNANDWSDTMLEKIGINKSMLPQIVDSTTVVGKISYELANELSMNEIDVIMGGGDNAVSALSLGLTKTGDTLISLGTSGVVYVANEEYIVTKNNALHSFSSVTGEYCQLGVTLAAAGSMQWYADEVIGTDDVKSLAGQTNFGGSNKVMYLPYISGERTPINDPMATGTFIGLRRSDNKFTIAQAIMEGVSFSIKQTYDILQNNNIEPTNVFVAGGGSKNKFWLETISTLLNIDLKVVNSEFGPFYGAAILAYKSSAKISFDDIRTQVSNLLDIEIIKPNEKAMSYLNKKYELWMKLYPATKEISNQLMKENWC